jgi:hypothetical protein
MTAEPMNREAWLTEVAEHMAPWFAELGHPLPKVRMAVGFTSKGNKGKRIGECWSGDASADGAFEIFIVPTIDDAIRVADILAHELVHAAVGLDAKHGPRFKKVARAIGLEGKMTATVAGPELAQKLARIVHEVGPLPHARLSDARLSSTPKPQKNRQLKCHCETCGYTARTTAKWIREAGAPICPTDMVPMTAPEVGDADEDDEGEE